jgi:uncharacterized coiled-coil protein SlyX
MDVLLSRWDTEHWTLIEQMTSQLQLLKQHVADLLYGLR